MRAETLRSGDILDEVMRYRALHWSIIPLVAGTKQPAKGFRWKRYQTKRPRTRELERWFRRPADIAVVLGTVSGGLMCRDFDDEAAYHEWAAQHPDLAQTLATSRTARGYHVYFEGDPTDNAIPSRKAYVTLGDGELRIRNCHCKLPPSRHQSGVYVWLVEPYHGLPIVRSVADAGLIPAGIQTGFGGARAPELYTCQHRPTHSQENLLYGDDGRLSEGGFDALLGWTIPMAKGQRENCIWQACRQLKTLPETRDLPIDELIPVIRRWHQLALPKIATKDYAETLGAFARAWERVKRPFSQGAEMHEYLERAKRAGCPAPIRDDFGQSVAGLVAALCRELAVAGDGQFFLDCRTLGRLFGVSHTTAAGYLRALIASRVIRRLTEPQKGRACEYRYLLSLRN